MTLLFDDAKRLEKAVGTEAAMAVGVFQKKVLGVFIGAACLAGCLYLTRRLK